MNKITELINEVTRMISDLHDGQNPAWQRPDDKEIIKLLEKVWVFLENFEPFNESSKEELESLCEDAYEELHDVIRSAEEAEDRLRKLAKAIENF
jgi:hypothetical protein